MMSRILLVDDDDTFRPALQKTLISLGHNVVPANNGEDALSIFSHSDFDLVISDIRMPKMDGVALTKAIKASKSTPVILITGFAEILETQEAHQLGCDEFLPKPFERDDLVAGIDNCLKKAKSEKTEFDFDYCKLAIEDFTSGRQIQFNVFVRLGDQKYVKIAYTGEDLSPNRVRTYKQKGIHYLYLRKDDFRTFVGFNVALTDGLRKNHIISETKKAALLKRTHDILVGEIDHHGVDGDLFDGSVTFVETTVDVLYDEPGVSDLLDALSKHTDYIFAHSVGTSLFSVLLAETVNWRLPVNKFKLSVGGLLHDVGQNAIKEELLMKPRSAWNFEDERAYEIHPLKSMDLLSPLKSIPSDVLHIVKEHHEDCQAKGFPSGLKKSACHPMSRLVAVANEFCNLTIKNPHYPKVTPHEAITRMSILTESRFDPAFFEALMRLFKFAPPEDFNKRKARVSL
jgi:response regulator RpfG family c-di-GMP phosphodiesterase